MIDRKSRQCDNSLSYNNGVGTINIGVHVANGHIEKSGIGNISANSINNVEAINDGMGRIHVLKSKKTLLSSNEGLGTINISQ